MMLVDPKPDEKRTVRMRGAKTSGTRAAHVTVTCPGNHFNLIKSERFKMNAP